VIDDAFDLNPIIIAEQGTLNLILIDVTTEPSGTLKLIEKYSPFLLNDGWLVAAFKATYSVGTVSDILRKVENLGFYEVSDVVLQVSRKEFHVVGKRR
jgi:hypothetical protein